VAETNEICVRLYSSLIPCPWTEHFPNLKSARKLLEARLEGFDIPMPDHMQGTLDLCQGCVQYDPVSVYIRED